MPLVFDNFLFQSYLFLFFTIINFCRNSSWKTRCFGVFLGLLPLLCHFKNSSIVINNTFIILPGIDFFLFLLFLFSFFKNFNNRVIIPELAKGNMTFLTGRLGLKWVDLIEIIKLYFSNLVIINNKILYLSKSMEFKDFPIAEYFIPDLKN